MKDFKKNQELFILALPAVILIFIISYIPMYGLILPFKKYRYDLGFWGSKWSGFENFKFLFQSDQILKITLNTVMYNLVFIVLGLVVSVAFAIMLNELTKKYVKVYQTIMLVPFFISWVVVTYIVQAFLDMEHGFLNSILSHFGVEAILWYNEPKYWPYILVISYLWKGVGYSTIIYYTALLGINSEYFEAAELDGANRLQQIRKISIPMLKPLIILLTILAIGRIFYGDFGLFFNLPKDSSTLYPATDVIDTYVYRSLKKLGDIGMSSAASMYQSVVGFILVLTTNFIVRKINKENALF